MNCPNDNDKMFALKWTKDGWLMCCGLCGYQIIGKDKNKKLEAEEKSEEEFE